MQWIVRGAARDTGRDIELRLEAPTARSAEEQANGMGVLVALVAPVAARGAAPHRVVVRESTTMADVAALVAAGFAVLAAGAAAITGLWLVTFALAGIGAILGAIALGSQPSIFGGLVAVGALLFALAIGGAQLLALPRSVPGWAVAGLGELDGDAATPRDPDRPTAPPTDPLEILVVDVRVLSGTVVVGVKATNRSGRHVRSAEGTCVLLDEDGKERCFEKRMIAYEHEGGIAPGASVYQNFHVQCDPALAKTTRISYRAEF